MRAAFALLFVVMTALSAFAQPSNNACSNALLLPLDGLLTGTTVGATNDGTTTCSSFPALQRDVWYRFVPPFTGSFVAELLDGGTLEDTVLSCHTGCPGTSANTIACNDDFRTNPLSRITFDGVAGQTYRLRVAGAGTSTGTFRLQIRAEAPSNDDCVDATTMLMGGTVSGYTYSATPDGETTCGTSAFGDVWYLISPVCDGLFGFSIENTNFAEVTFSVHSGCPFGNDTNTIFCNEFSPTSLLEVQLQLEGQVPYWLRVAGSNLDAGYFTLRTRGIPIADECSNATSLVTGQSRLYGNCSATLSPQPLGCTFASGEFSTDVWFRWIATCDGIATVSVCESRTDTRLAVYRGPTCPTAGAGPDVIGCDDDGCGDDGIVEFSCAEGNQYFFRVGSGQQNVGIISVTCEPRCRWRADGCRADYNNDEGIDGDDVIAFFVNWDRGDECADVDRSEGVDGDDVITFFFDWDRGGTGAPGC